MSLSRFARLTLPASLLLLFACAETKPAQAPHAEALHSPADDYVTLVPSVSVSKAETQAPQKQASLDPDEDVMAEILAIPPGR